MKFTTISIDDKEYRLEYDLNALADCEEEAGCNLLEALALQGENNARQLRGLLYGFLHLHHPDVTIQQAGKMIRMDTMALVVTGVSEAFAKAASEEVYQQWLEQVKPQESDDEEEAHEEAGSGAD